MEELRIAIELINQFGLLNFIAAYLLFRTSKQLDHLEHAFEKLQHNIKEENKNMKEELRNDIKTLREELYFYENLHQSGARSERNSRSGCGQSDIETKGV